MRLFHPALAIAVVALPPHATAQSKSADWNGEYLLVGHGFEEGDRTAGLLVIMNDTLCSCQILGPEGTLKSAVLRGDTLHVSWDLGEPGELLIDIARNGDQVGGSWSMGMAGGAVSGSRKRQ